MEILKFKMKRTHQKNRKINKFLETQIRKWEFYYTSKYIAAYLKLTADKNEHKNLFIRVFR